MLGCQHFPLFSLFQDSAKKVSKRQELIKFLLYVKDFIKRRAKLHMLQAAPAILLSTNLMILKSFVMLLSTYLIILKSSTN